MLRLPIWSPPPRLLAPPEALRFEAPAPPVSPRADPPNLFAVARSP
jgi:hypothetical protein